MADGGARQATETGDLADQTTGLAVRERARLNGLEISEADARDLQPYYDQHQRWLEKLRGVLGEGEEPATVFSAGDTRDARE